MDVDFFVIIIVLQLLWLVSMGFWLYWPATLWLAYRARTLKLGSGALFALSVAVQFIMFFVVMCVGVMSVGVIPLAGLVPFFGGIIGWIVVGVQRYRSRAEVRRFINERPVLKMQCSMRDIYTAVLFFSVVMALCTLGHQAAMDEEAQVSVMVLAAYFILATGIGFYVALDVLRRPPEPYSALQRFWALLGILLVFSVSGVVGGLLVWRTWQKALQTVGMAEWQRSRSVENPQPETA